MKLIYSAFELDCIPFNRVYSVKVLADFFDLPTQGDTTLAELVSTFSGITTLTV